jgi:hypothetical protein
MQALKDIGWFVLLIVSFVAVFEFVGWRGLVRMFPKGWRWWMLPLQLISLAAFTAVVYFNPWSYHGL